MTEALSKARRKRQPAPNTGAPSTHEQSAARTSRVSGPPVVTATPDTRSSPALHVAAQVRTADVAALSVRLEIRITQILRVVQLSERTFARRKQQHTLLSRSESDRVKCVLRVTEEAERVFGDAKRAHSWLKHAHPLLGATPLDLLATDEGAQRVQRELLRIEWGDCT